MTTARRIRIAGSLLLSVLCFSFATAFGGVALLQGFNEIGTVGDSRFGNSVSGAGDVNNDGYDDVIVGAYGYNSYAGRAYVYFGGPSMNNDADVILTGPSASSFGSFLSAAGDVNSDGYDDVIVGAPQIGSYMGRAYVYFGGSAMNSAADVTITGTASNQYLGCSVSGAGDLNDDGYDDVIVGAYGTTSLTGQANVYFGGSSMNAAADLTMTGEATNDRFGCSVSGAGDVNGDTYPDVIVGAQGYGSSTGKTYLYFGGPSMDNTVDVTMTGETTSNYFGHSVSGAGDADGDGYDDVIAGAYGHNSQTGRAYVFLGDASMDNAADVTMTGEATGNYFGISVSGAGDADGDGYDDVIAGAYGHNSQTGRAYVYLGDASMDNAADLTLTGENATDWFGYSVSGAGDFDGDGFDDVIAGANSYVTGTGRAYVYLGGSSMNGSADATMTGEPTSNYFGISVSGAGDVNGDGYDDVIIGAQGYNKSTGRAYLYFGGSPVDAAADVTFTGEATGNEYGHSVSGAGDVNGDGYDDVIIGAHKYDSAKGRAYLHFGGPSMDASAEVTMIGAGNNNYLGISVSGAGDVNGDGFDDVIIGAQGGSTGSAYVLYGGSPMNNAADVTMTGEAAGTYFAYSVSGAGDADGDGYDDVIVGAYGYNSSTGRAYVYFGGSSMDNGADVTMTGEAIANSFGCSVSGAGDANGDGYDDVIIGATMIDSYKGRAYVYHGGPSMDNAADITMSGEGTTNNFGCSVSGAGDVNLDGYADVIVGANWYSSETGRAYVFCGGSAMDNTADFTLTGEGTGNQFGYAVSDAGDVNGDGMDDLIIGANNASDSDGKAYVYSIYVIARTKTWLESPYQAGGSMTTALKTAESIPLTSPYTDGRTVSAVPDGVTDWVSLELRAAAAGSSVCQKSFFLKSNGTVVDADGSTTDLKMPGLADGGYYLIARHRNHLSAMSALSISLNTSPASLYDFSTGLSQYYGGDAKLLETGVYGLYSGDTNATGTVDANDRSAAWNDRNKTGYENSDCNLSGTVDANDRSIAWNNRNKTTSVP